MKYLARLNRELDPHELAVFEPFGLSERFARLLFIRGIDTEEKLNKFFSASADMLYDPFLLKGMDDAVKRINTAIANKEHILIIGDYDADGICSVAILYKYLLTRHVPTRYFLPDRNDDGYGLNIELIEKLNTRFHPNLIITVDCGISCASEIEFAKSLGIDCIVTDHHAIPKTVPDCTCINPKFTDQEYPFSELCGAGVAFKLVHALGGRDSALEYIDICALATVADIVSLTSENRIIVKLGLEKLNLGSLPSISALSKSCNIYGRIVSTDISYKICPKINASGRMGNAKRGLDMILEQNEAEIHKIVASLNNYNLQRQRLCNTIYSQVEAVIARDNLAENNIIIVADKKWESGVLGIVAARVAEKYGKPVMVFGKSGDIYKGSSRSVGNINIVRTIERFASLVLTYGGHSMAAGLSVHADNFAKFQEQLTDFLAKNYSHVDLASDRFYDFDLELEEITTAFVKELSGLEPVGCDNPSPLFATRIDVPIMASSPSHLTHLRFSLPNSMQLVYFNGAMCAELLAYAFPKKIVYEFQKIDDSNHLKGITKAIIPMPNCEKSYGLTLYCFLKNVVFYEPDNKFFAIIQELSCDRDVFVECYLALLRQERTHGGLVDIYASIKKQKPSFNFYQFVFASAVFEELKILNRTSGRVEINKSATTELAKSMAYNMVQKMQSDTCDKDTLQDTDADNDTEIVSLNHDETQSDDNQNNEQIQDEDSISDSEKSEINEKVLVKLSNI